MNNTMAALLTEPHTATPHRYQVYRQDRNGLHYNHGPILDSPEEAVALFLQTTPAFEGGGVSQVDHCDGARRLACGVLILSRRAAIGYSPCMAAPTAPTVRFAIQTPQEGATFETLATHWREAEALGFDSVFLT